MKMIKAQHLHQYGSLPDLTGNILAENVSEFREELGRILDELQVPNSKVSSIMEACIKHVVEFPDDDGDLSLNITVTPIKETARIFLTLNNTYWSNDLGNRGCDFEQVVEQGCVLLGEGVAFGSLYEHSESDNGNVITHIGPEKAEPKFDSEFVALVTQITDEERSLERCHYSKVTLCFYIPEA